MIATMMNTFFAAKFSQSVIIHCYRSFGSSAVIDGTVLLFCLSSECPPIEIAILAVFQDHPGICQFVPFDHRPPAHWLTASFPPSRLSFPASGITAASIYLPPSHLLLTIDSSSSFRFFVFSPSISLQLFYRAPRFFIFFYFCSLFFSHFCLYPFSSSPPNLTLRFLIYRFLFLVPCQPIQPQIFLFDRLAKKSRWFWNLLYYPLNLGIRSGSHPERGRHFSMGHHVDATKSWTASMTAFSTYSIHFQCTKSSIYYVRNFFFSFFLPLFLSLILFLLFSFPVDGLFIFL